MKKKLLLLGSALALLASCQNGNKPTEDNAASTCTGSTAETETVQSWPKLDQSGHYVRQEGDPLFLVSDYNRKQFAHPIGAGDTITNSNQYTKILWKDYVFKIASGEFLCGDKADMYVESNFESMRGPLFVPIDQEETVKLSKRMKTQWSGFLPVAFTEKALEHRQVLSFSDKKNWDDIRKMEDSLQAKVTEKYGLEIASTEWIANINNNSLKLYQVQYKPKDNKAIAAVVAFKEDGSIFCSNDTTEVVNGEASWNVDDGGNKIAPIISCALETEEKAIEIYYYIGAPESLTTGLFILDASSLRKSVMNSWYVYQN